MRALWGAIRTEITAGWQTEDHPREKLTVADEREHVLFYLTEVLYRVVPPFYEEVALALEKVYGVPAEKIELPTLVSFGTWVGGDMDGSLDVHAKSIRETLARQQQVIVNTYLPRNPEARAALVAECEPNQRVAGAWRSASMNT